MVDTKIHSLNKQQYDTIVRNVNLKVIFKSHWGAIKT